jgi:hypothetical protein
MFSLSSGKKAELAYIETSTSVINEAETHGGKDVLLRCIIAPELVNKLGGRAVDFHFYAKNDIRDIVFELTDESYQPFKTRAEPVTGRRHMVFDASWDMLFYRNLNGSPYRWQWTGKAEAPLSPLVDIGDQKVKKIQCWFTVNLNGKTYTSKKISYHINP